MLAVENVCIRFRHIILFSITFFCASFFSLFFALLFHDVNLIFFFYIRIDSKRWKGMFVCTEMWVSVCLYVECALRVDDRQSFSSLFFFTFSLLYMAHGSRLSVLSITFVGYLLKTTIRTHFIQKLEIYIHSRVVRYIFQIRIYGNGQSDGKIRWRKYVTCMCYDATSIKYNNNGNKMCALCCEWSIILEHMPS